MKEKIIDAVCSLFNLQRIPEPVPEVDFREEFLEKEFDKTGYALDMWQDGKQEFKRLNDSVQNDTEFFITVVDNFLGKADYFKSAEDLVYFLDSRIREKMPVKYRSDKQKWGKTEYWESAVELFEEYRKKGYISGDCDTYALFKYYTIREALFKFGFLNDIDRLRLALVKFHGQKLERHLNLVWYKEDLREWVFIETTLNPERNWLFWHNKAKDQVTYEVEYTFDSFGVYKWHKNM